MVILSLSMKFSSRLMANNTASGERLIRKACPMSGVNAVGMVMSLMYTSKSDVMVQQLSDSLRGY